jgi:hypothetical protein
MSSNGISKRRFLSSTQRRHNAVALVEAFGNKATAMGRCSACVHSNSVCWMLEGQSMCGACKRKNKKVGECDGVFSREEFDNLEAQRNRALAEAEAKDKELELLLSALQKNRQEKSALQARAQKFREQQQQMLSRELAALDEIDSSSDDPPSIALDGSFDWSEVLQLGPTPPASS